MKNKKTIIAIISVVAVILVLIGVTYAYWLVTKEQVGENVISSACLDISLNGSGDINLPNQYPMSDDDGLKTTPYTFTVTNNCKTSIDYQINLETLGSEENTILPSAIKIALNESGVTNIVPVLLSEKSVVNPTIANAYTANKLLVGTLSANSDETTKDTVTYELRLWLDKDAPISEANKTFTSKITVTVGQSVNNPIKEGTLAYNILSNYGGVDAATIYNTGSTETTPSDDKQVFALDYSRGIHRFATEYAFDSKTGEYSLAGTIVEATVEECRSGAKICGQYALSTIATNFDDEAYDSDNYTKAPYLLTISSFSCSRGDSSNGDIVMYCITAKVQSGTNMYSEASNTPETGVYKAEDDDGVSYYFRGAPTNNYVKFGEYANDYKLWKSPSLGGYKFATESECVETTTSVNGTSDCIEEIYLAKGTPMYWRIVRINGDGTIRLIYDGTEPVANGIAHSALMPDEYVRQLTMGTGYAGSIFNSSANDKKYVGYVYDESNTSSSIKLRVDDWYATNLKTTYEKYIADSVFCNDREVAGLDSTGLMFYYQARWRIEEYKTPKLTCTNEDDKLNVKNEKLTNPVGLITADEVFMAGGNIANSSYYLYTGRGYWTMTPLAYDAFDSGAPAAMIFLVSDDGKVGSSGTVGGNEVPGHVNGAFATSGSLPSTRPVINLKADVKFTGDGRIDTNTPYEIVME